MDSNPSDQPTRAPGDLDRMPREWFARDARSVARDLIGHELVRILPDGTLLGGIITETEAYVGPEDLASHAKGGHRSPRNESMWGQPGTAYVYFTYGMHYCFNIACYRADHPAAVLVRAIDPTRGIEIMRENRSRRPRKRPLPDAQLCDGPAKLCQALAIDKSLDAEDFLQSAQLAIVRGESLKDERVECTARIGIGAGHDWVHKPLRWVRIMHPSS